MPIEFVLLGLAVGAGNLATALVLGALGQAYRKARIVALFGVFEFTGPLVGLWIGESVSPYIEERLGWLGVAVIGGLGLWTILGAWRDPHEEERLARRVTSWSGLVALAATLAVDNLLVGFGLGLRHSPLQAAFVIGTSAAAFSWVGIWTGNAARRHWARRAKFGSGAVLVSIAGMMYSGWI